MSKTSSTVKNRYNAKTYDTISLVVPKGTKAVFREKCESNGETMNGVLNKLIKKYLESTDQ